MQHALPEDYAEVQEGLNPNQVNEVSYTSQSCVRPQQHFLVVHIDPPTYSILSNMETSHPANRSIRMMLLVAAQ